MHVRTQVIWVDLLTKEEFTAGFGSHTPIFTGQTKCARYYMNFERALALLKEVLAEVRFFYIESAHTYLKLLWLHVHDQHFHLPDPAIVGPIAQIPVSAAACIAGGKSI